MKSTYTPGPWELQSGRIIKTVSGSFYLSYGKDKHGNPDFRDFCELDRNAKLIAAAPDLLAALDAFVNPSSSVMPSEAKRIALAAIAKARGEVE